MDYTINFSALSNSSFIQYCDSNISLFSLASYEAIALPTIAKAIVVALSCSQRRYIAKSKGKIIAISRS